MTNFNITKKRATEIFTLLFGNTENVYMDSDETMERILKVYQDNEISLCELIEISFKLGKLGE